MLAPISARFASSCSRNGTSEAATDTICAGDTSMYWMRSAPTRIDSPASTRGDQVAGQLAVLVQRRIGLGDDVLAFLDGRQVVDLIGDLAVDHRRYGVSMKPYSFRRAYRASELIRPMFGPSGVSIGHTRP